MSGTSINEGQGELSLSITTVPFISAPATKSFSTKSSLKRGEYPQAVG